MCAEPGPARERTLRLPQYRFAFRSLLVSRPFPIRFGRSMVPTTRARVLWLSTEHSPQSKARHLFNQSQTPTGIANRGLSLDVGAPRWPRGRNRRSPTPHDTVWFDRSRDVCGFSGKAKSSACRDAACGEVEVARLFRAVASAAAARLRPNDRDAICISFSPHDSVVSSTRFGLGDSSNNSQRSVAFQNTQRSSQSLDTSLNQSQTLTRIANRHCRWTRPRAASSSIECQSSSPVAARNTQYDNKTHA